MADRRFAALLVAGACCAALLPAVALAQAGADRRLDKVERDLRTLQTIVMQAQATGQPVVVKPEGTDPGVADLQSRVGDLEMTLQRINGQVETLAHDMDEVRRAAQAAAADRQTQAQALNERLARIEGQLAGLGQAGVAATPAAAPAAAPPIGAPPADAAVAPPAPAPAAATPPPRGGQAAADATARAQAEDRGLLGGGTAPAPSPTEAFNAARALYTSGAHARAVSALQDFVTRYPTNARTPEAYYWLGEAFFAQKDYQSAIAAYASALKARPTTTWAAAGMIKLADSLTRANQPAQACAALSEYDTRYAARATAPVRATATSVRKRARCE